MLFKIKNRLILTLCAIAVFLFFSSAAKIGLDLNWNLTLGANTLICVAIGVGIIGVSDGIVHLLLWLVWGKAYFDRYLELAEYFRPQGVPEILAGGFLASAEELIFRGVLLQGILSAYPSALSQGLGIGATSLIFGAVHILPEQPRLRPFFFWAVWESVILSCLYIWSGSLLVCMIVHGIHDIAGFTAFKLQRYWNEKDSKDKKDKKDNKGSGRNL